MFATDEEVTRALSPRARAFAARVVYARAQARGLGADAGTQAGGAIGTAVGSTFGSFFGTILQGAGAVAQTIPGIASAFGINKGEQQQQKLAEETIRAQERISLADAEASVSRSRDLVQIAKTAAPWVGGGFVLVLATILLARRSPATVRPSPASSQSPVPIKANARRRGSKSRLVLVRSGVAA